VPIAYDGISAPSLPYSTLLAAGFMLRGPALTLRFQAISHSLEQGGRPSFSGALLAWRANAGPIFYAGVAFMFLFRNYQRSPRFMDGSVPRMRPSGASHRASDPT
jgi:hypothetical protein